MLRLASRSQTTKEIAMTEYKIHTYKKAVDGTLYSLAKSELGDGSRWKEFLLETSPNSGQWKPATESYLDGVRVKIPLVSPPAVSSDFSNLTITAPDGVNLRSGPGTQHGVLIPGIENKNKPFQYRISSVRADGQYVWAEVTDNHGNSKGWICVKEGNNYYAVPNIDA
jgi:hypothetical protein